MPTADELFVQAVAAHRTGDVGAAERAYRQLLSAVPDHPDALTNLGNIVFARGDTAEAERLYRAALAANPDHVEAHFKLGNLYRRARRFAEAAPAYEEVLRRVLDEPAALVNLGLAVSAAGDWPYAVDCFGRAAAVAPHLPDVLLLYGDALGRVGRVLDAIDAEREAVVRFPDDPRGYLNLGLHLFAAGAATEAIDSYERALALNPEYAEAHNGLGIALEAVGRVDEAQAHYREAVRIRPEFAPAWANLGTCLIEQGQAAEADHALREALGLAPDDMTHSKLLVLRVTSADVSPEQLCGDHVAWASAYADHLAPPNPPVPRRAAGGQIRVGYVFGELWSHATRGFVEALFTHHDRAQFHVTAYPSNPCPDPAFDRLRLLTDVWKPIAHRADDRAADLIRADGIDVLVDLHGHTPGNRLLVFAQKPAAVQITMFGYPTTTGMSAMDYRVTDATTDPPGETESHYVEKLLRLPDLGWVYVPPTDAPAPNALPVARGRGFTFGCLNHPGKLTDPCIEAWSAILKAVPRSRLVVLIGQTTASAKALAARFTRHGIASDRIEPVYRLSVSDYFAAYQPFDMALDPFPCGGAVTTCDALWMGVPVLTVAGRDARSRQGMSLPNALGLPEFVADTPEQLVGLAATWADQRDALADLRGTLREMMQQSPLTVAADYVKHLEAAFRSALSWRDLARIAPPHPRRRRRGLSPEDGGEAENRPTS